MKVYEYNEIQGYNNVDEIMREKTIVFGSINEGKIVKIFYKNSLCSRDVFEINISYFDNGKKCRNKDFPSIMFYDKNFKLSQEVYLNDNDKVSRENGPAWIFYRPDETVEVEKWYRDGRLHREEGKPAIVRYNNKGGIYKEVFYSNGSKNNSFGAAEVYYNKDGSIDREMYFKNGKSVYAKVILDKIKKVKDGSISKSINRMSNIETINDYEKIAEYFNKNDVIELIKARKVILTLQGKI